MTDVSESSKEKNDKPTRRKKKSAVREVRINDRILYQVYLGSVRQERDGKIVRHQKRRTFADKQEAEIFAERMKIQKFNYGIAALSISDQLRTEAIEAQRILEPHGVTISDAARFYANHLEGQKKAGS
jgi:hypothetical protein